MKSVLLLVAATMIATPAAAGGYVGLEYGNTDLNGGGGEGDIWQGEGELGWKHGNWGGQVGAQLGNLAFDTGGDTDFWGLNAHLFFDGGGWRLGAVIASTTLDFVGGEVDEVAYGVEGMLDITSNANLFSNFTVGELDFIGGTYDTWNLDAGANYYFTPNIRVGASVGTGNLERPGVDIDTMSYGINAEFQPWSAPVSITLAWNSFELVDTAITSAVSAWARDGILAGAHCKNEMAPFRSQPQPA